MSHLSTMRTSVLMAICAISYLLAAAQTIHACSVAMRRGMQARRLAVCYEALVAVHLVLICAAASSAMENQGHILLWLHPVLLPIEPLLWVDAVAAALGALLALRCRRASMSGEVALLALCTPAAIDAAGRGSIVLMAVDVSYFAARSAALLALDWRSSKASVSRLSIVDALDALPEGVMWMNGACEVLFMNDAMREVLTALGLMTDLADAHGLWEQLCAFAQEEEDGRLIVATGEGTARLFVRDEVVLRHRLCQRIMAIDVSEEAALNVRLERVNRLLEAANEELRASMAEVRRVAEEEASMRMRARVHDTVGSRLSILHRYLEDGNDDPETLEKICGLLSRIMDDLAEPERHAAGLSPICGAFALIGVEVQVAGELPQDEEVASAFAEIVLEAVTNAAKHAQARHVDVKLQGDGGAEGAYLSVRNDGASPAEVVEGTGIPAMRRTAQGIGATFAIRSTQPFTIEVVLPPRGGAAPMLPDEGGQP